MRKLTTAIVTTGLAAVAVAGCNSPTKNDEINTPAPGALSSSSSSNQDIGGSVGTAAFVAAATDATRQARTVMIKETGTILGQPISATGGLRFSGDSIEADVKEQGALGDVEVIYLQKAFYIKGIEKGDPGKPWIKDSSLSNTIGPLIKKADPGQTLQLLTMTSTVTPVGTETINGVRTTHYAAKIDLVKLAQRAPQLAKLYQDAMQAGVKTQAFDVWVDAQQRPARVRTSVVTPNPIDKSKPIAISQTVDYTDWGGPVEIQAPPADQVTEH